MEAIVLTDDELKVLERRFGPKVRQMGSWNSDGTFGYASVPKTTVVKAAEALEHPNLMEAVSRLKDTPEETKLFIELLETFGTALVEKIVTTYRECALGLLANTGLAPRPPMRESENVALRTAAA